MVGLAHAYHALRRGLSVTVVDYAARAVGSSVQNFGHACITAQSGTALHYARRGRPHWLRLAREAGFWAKESGTHCVLRGPLELAVAHEFCAASEPGEAQLLSRDELLARVPVAGTDVTGGMFLPNDLQVDPRDAVPAIARWLEARGVRFLWRTSAITVEPGLVRTSRGSVRADDIVVAVNHEVDRFFPELADRYGLRRCALHMLRVAPQRPLSLPTPVFTGWSLARYSRFAALPSTAELARSLAEAHPVAARHDLHLMAAPQPDGSILLGDTHRAAASIEPFQSEEGFDLLLQHGRELFGAAELDVLERWQGVYCSGSAGDFLVEEPLPGVHVATVATGIGMTTGLGLAEVVVDRIFGSRSDPLPSAHADETQDSRRRAQKAEAAEQAREERKESKDAAQAAARNPEPVALVVFDMAGTTVQDDGLVVASFLAADEAVGLSASAEERAAMIDYAKATMGQSKIVVFRHLARGDEAKAQAANAVFERSYQEMVLGGRISPIPGAEAAFQWLREHDVKIALTTGFARTTQHAILDALGWREVADVVLCPGEGIRGRPYPDMPLTALLRAEAASVGSMVVVGDSVSDIASGLAAGAGESIGVLSGAHDRARLESAGATSVLSSVAELPAHLASRVGTR